MNDPAGRIEFVRQLYNLLCVESDATQAEDTQAAVSELNGKIRRLPMKSMFTRVDKAVRSVVVVKMTITTLALAKTMEVTTHSSEHMAMRCNRTLLWMPVAANGGHFSRS